ncbi:hypothetical protein MT962_000609 [Franconibacter sp. IITDAS19]|uniref:hypothetical protein n=1 Tax=Franconibacter sp. IITDAS19 TaxID=2930569 RepID=UPI001FF9E82E|nr:hypothetical protein [Franconibacter sp. IITDAS19]MCK1966823.1 hypothetical protein [Franconibacter sp. IITDAS19]
MESPLPGAGSLRPFSSPGTREEVLERIKSHLQETLGKQYETESKEARMTRQADALADSRLNHRNLAASFYPRWLVVGPVKPEYTDIRARSFRGRYGHWRSE